MRKRVDASFDSHTHQHPNQNTNKTQVSGGYNVGQVLGAFSCQTPVANAFDYEACPYELRVYQDAIPGTVVRDLMLPFGSIGCLSPI